MLNVHERQYLTTKQEGHEVVWAVDYFNSYIMEKPFNTVTYYDAFNALKTKANLEAKMFYYAKWLSSYQF